MTHRPILTHTRDQLAEALARLPGTKALVMTMGALHAGHLQLVRAAHALADHVIVTIFVNPTQFAPGEDFDAYPRTLGADMDALETVGADLVWAPSPQDVYPAPATVSIDPGPVARVLEGKTRPTHFAGVALVCTKVVNLVRPDVALYGQKDAQQLAVLRAVFSQLDIPVRIHAVPIVRYRDGVHCAGAWRWPRRGQNPGASSPRAERSSTRRTASTWTTSPSWMREPSRSSREPTACHSGRQRQRRRC